MVGKNANKKKVLIVDDTPQNIQILKTVLEGEYAIIAARDGLKALALAEKAPQPDIILLDIMMPEMDGYEVCRRLKKNEATRDIPVVFVTALSECEDEERGLSMGGIDYLTKPINPAIVKARVRNHIALHEATVALADQNRQLIEAAKLREDVEMITRHDLKSPLNVILAYPDMMLLEGNLSEKQTQGIKRIQSAGYRMLEMINHSLDLYKMETGSYKLNPNRVNLVDVLFSVVGECDTMCAEKEVDIKLESGGEAIAPGFQFFIQGEDMLCHTLFANLVKNAVEASALGEHVRISLQRGERMAEISVHNVGQVPEDMRGRFFVKYATSGKHNGTGLGTYSARLCAEVQNGEIGMETDEKGTTVSVLLPLAE